MTIFFCKIKVGFISGERLLPLESSNLFQSLPNNSNGTCDGCIHKLKEGTDEQMSYFAKEPNEGRTLPKNQMLYSHNAFGSIHVSSIRVQ